MYFSDSTGNVVGVQDSVDKKRINLISPEDKVIKVKVSLANKFVFYSFAYRNDETKQDVFISMKNIIDDGVKEGGDYVYRF